MELESVVGQYQTSLRRIALLESEMSKIAELQKENGNLKNKLQVSLSLSLIALFLVDAHFLARIKLDPTRFAEK